MEACACWRFPFDEVMESLRAPEPNTGSYVANGEILVSERKEGGRFRFREGYRSSWNVGGGGDTTVEAVVLPDGAMLLEESACSIIAGGAGFDGVIFPIPSGEETCVGETAAARAARRSFFR